MLDEIWKTESRLVRERAGDMVDMLLEEREDVLKNALFLIRQCLEDADITIYDKERGQIVATTVNNVDSFDSLDFSLHMIFHNCREIKGIEDILTLDKKNSSYCRHGVKKFVVIPLYTGLIKDSVLCVEYFSRREGMPLSHLEPIFKILTLAVRMRGLSINMAETKNTDFFTGLPLREALYDRLREICAAQEKVCLGILCITSAGRMNERHGIKFVDKLLGAVGRIIKDMFPRNAFRMSGTKFAILFYRSKEASVSSLESVMDRILTIDTEIVTASVLTEVSEDVYSTIHICESNLKYAKEDVVTVVRRAAGIDFEKEYAEVTETYFADEGRIRKADIEGETAGCKKADAQDKKQASSTETLYEEENDKETKTVTLEKDYTDMPSSGKNDEEKQNRDMTEYYEDIADGFEEGYDGEIPPWAYSDAGGDG